MLKFPEKPENLKEQYLFTYVEELQKYCIKTVRAWSIWTKDSNVSLEDQVKDLLGNIGVGIIENFRQDLRNDQIPLFKTPDAKGFANYFHLFPNTKVVILMRDGRDTVESFISSWAGEQIFKDITKRWRERMLEVQSFIDRCRFSQCEDRYCLINYDSLHLNTREEVNKILEFLDLDSSVYPWDEMDNAPVLGSSSFRGENKKVNWTPVSKDESFNPTNKWQSWPEKKKKYFKQHCGQLLIDFGFEKDTSW